MPKGTGYVAKTAVQHDGVLFAPGTDLPPLSPREEAQLLAAGALAQHPDEVIDPETDQLRAGIVGNSLVSHAQGVFAVEPVSGEVLMGGDQVPVYAQATSDRLPDPSRSVAAARQGQAEKTRQSVDELATRARQARETGTTEESKGKCQGKKADGADCQLTAEPNGFCRFHQDQASAAGAAGTRAGSASGSDAATAAAARHEGDPAGSNVHGPEGGEKRMGG